MIELKDVLTLVGLLFTAGVSFWAVIRWTIGKIESKHAEAQQYTDTRHSTAIEYITRVDGRVNEVKDEYVKRSELDRDFKALEKQIDSMNKAFAEGRAETNQRLDRMLMLLGKVISHNSKIDDQ
jgi:hypothetical protein